MKTYKPAIHVLQQSLGRLQQTQTQLLAATEKLQHDALLRFFNQFAQSHLFYEFAEPGDSSKHRRHPERLFAVLFIDLDRFKNINDSLGHLVGDEFLKLAGQRLEGCVEPSHMVARFGGDEFAVLLNELSHPDDALAHCPTDL
jgi:diguanylate cyclase (GGDEF)-like protein